MTEIEFDELVEERCNKIKQTLSIKAKEYHRNNNPLHNFETGGRMFNQTPTKVLDGFLNKHLISYRDILDDIDNNRKIDINLVEEKLGDIINYFILQEAIIKDKYTVPF